MDYQLTKHAGEVMQERGIVREWLERALSHPALVEPSNRDPALESRFVKIPEFADRVLRVVVNKQIVPERVVSVYFDRTMKGKI
jgi:hypothetical protein